MTTATTTRTFVPRGDIVFVRPQSADEMTASGIIIPATVEAEIPTSGVVVSVGPDVASDIQPGKIVLFGAYAATELEVQGETLWTIRDRDLMSVGDPESADGN